MKIISVVNGKGGVGKSTMCIALAVLRSSMGRKVLLGDWDNQGNTTKAFVALSNIINKPSIYDVFNGSYVEPINVMPGLDLLPATSNLLQLDKSVNTEELFQLGDNLRKFYSSYDDIILDTPGTLGTRVSMGLIAADGVVVPTDLDEFSFQALEQLFSAMKPIWRALNPQMKFVGIIANKVDGIGETTGEPVLLSERNAYFSLRDILANNNMSEKILGLVGKRESIKELRSQGKLKLDQKAMTELSVVSQRITEALLVK